MTELPPASSRTAPLAPADRLEGIERPLPGESGAVFGSDVVAETLRDLGIPYIAMVPGSSFRGFQDSLINRLGNQDPRMLVCLHEEASVAIAHGYAKATGKAMAAALHANVGLMHAAMAVFNAWCDRMPMLIIGATGPLDATERRPWIEWIHTSRDQGALLRGYVKWDDLPYSPAAAREALIRARWIAETVPQGPTYVCLDAGMQEAELAEPPLKSSAARLAPRVETSIGARAIAEAASLLENARAPLILVGRVSRSAEGWRQRVELAERLGARVATDLKIGAGFPTDHPLHVGVPASRLVPDARRAVREADVIVSLDWVDLAGTLSAACEGAEPSARVIQISRDHVIHNGAHMDHQALSVADLFLSADPDAVVGDLLAAIDRPRGDYRLPELTPPPIEPVGEERTIRDLAMSLRRAVGSSPFSFSNLPLSWNGGFWPFRGPLDYLGLNGGAGVGGGPGIAVGAALALRDDERISIGICGDGDFIMGHTALWTAVHYGIPMLLVVANNRCYYNDVKHQEQVAVRRGRQVENKWLGQNIMDPDVDIAGLARAQGAAGYGPVQAKDDLDAIFKEALDAVRAGGVAVVDVRIQAGYAG